MEELQLHLDLSFTGTKEKLQVWQLMEDQQKN